MSDHPVSNTEQELLSRLADLELDRLLEYRRLTAQQHTEAYKWLAASYLALNGGLAVSLLNTHLVSAHLTAASLAILLIGILSALFCAKFSQSSYQKYQSPVNTLVGYWAKVAIEKERRIDLETQLEAEMSAVSRYGKRVGFFGWVSISAFVVASLIVGAGLVQNANKTIECSKPVASEQK